MLSSFPSMYINDNLLCALAQMKVAGELYKAFEFAAGKNKCKMTGFKKH